MGLSLSKVERQLTTIFTQQKSLRVEAVGGNTQRQRKQEQTETDIEEEDARILASLKKEDQAAAVKTPCSHGGSKNGLLLVIPRLDKQGGLE